jgi:hypothetical protein
MGKDDPGFEASHVLKDALRRRTWDERRQARIDTRIPWTTDEIKQAKKFIKTMRKDKDTVQPHV